jgi:hypothetical protein
VATSPGGPARGAPGCNGGDSCFISHAPLFFARGAHPEAADAVAPPPLPPLFPLPLPPPSPLSPHLTPEPKRKRSDKALLFTCGDLFREVLPPRGPRRRSPGQPASTSCVAPKCRAVFMLTGKAERAADCVMPSVPHRGHRSISEPVSPAGRAVARDSYTIHGAREASRWRPPVLRSIRRVDRCVWRSPWPAPEEAPEHRAGRGGATSRLQHPRSP